MKNIRKKLRQARGPAPGADMKLTSDHVVDGLQSAGNVLAIALCLIVGACSRAGTVLGLVITYVMPPLLLLAGNVSGAAAHRHPTGRLRRESNRRP